MTSKVLEGTKALQKWCQIITGPYDNVNILNMTTSWRSGLGFCAIIHHFRPDLIDYKALNPEKIFENNELAFKIGETHLGIPALLDAEDMVGAELLDRLSILTYLSQYYAAFQGCSTNVSNNSHTVKALHQSPPRRTPRIKDICIICQEPVLFLLERFSVNGALLHRTCFKCKRCSAQLSLANYYETENGDFCCDMCPDEENVVSSKGSVKEEIREIDANTDEEENENSSVEVSLISETFIVVNQEEEMTNETQNHWNESENEENDEKTKEKMETTTLMELKEINLNESKEEEYPDDLNPFGDEEEYEDKKEENKIKNDEGDDEEDEEEDSKSYIGVTNDKNPFESDESKSVTNPFGSDSEEDLSTLHVGPPKPPRSHLITSTNSPKKKKRQAPLPPPRHRNNSKFSKNEEGIETKNICSKEEELGKWSLFQDKAELEGGQWRKKKGPAPPRPKPPKRVVKKLPKKAVDTELADIEIKQQGLERQGVKLEKRIRDVCERDDREKLESKTSEGLSDNRDSLDPEAEDLIIQLFDLVNEKNDLFRRQTELMYMRRDHRLEEEHADIEHQIRILMESNSVDKEEEEEILIARLMEIVSQRNEIVDCLEMDRLRELEEDESIENHLEEYAAVKTDESLSEKKKKKKKKKLKEMKKKKSKDFAFDADKDIDTKEFPNDTFFPSPKPSPKKETAKKLKKKIFKSVTLLTRKQEKLN